MSSGDLFELYRDFHAELVVMKRRALAGDWVFSAVEATDDDGTPLGGIDAVSQRLVALLRRVAPPGEDTGEEGRRTSPAREAQYVMAALADEVFLHALEWEGKAAWRDNLIEARLFGTYVGGERFFVKLDELLHRDDPADRDLAAIFLMALAAGFKGKYRGNNDKGAVKACRRKLHTFLVRHDPDFAERGELFPEAYAQTLSGGDPTMLPDARPWVILFASFLLVFLVASHVLWLILSAETRAIVGGGG